MEYATREQAQHAVNTLSNQNLMGRLVYVREVRSSRDLSSCSFAPPSIGDESGRSYGWADENRFRIVRSNLALRDRPAALVEVTRGVLLVADTRAGIVEQVAEADVSSMCPTSVLIILPRWRP